MDYDYWLISVFPGLVSSPYQITSPPDKRYNCIAWAAGDKTRWWEPDPMGQYYWPPSVSRDYTVASHMRVFQGLGYSECDENVSQESVTKVALFAKTDGPKHASRQLDSSLWTSKLGTSVDISHELYSLCGELYGDVVKLLRRSEPAI